MEVTVEGVQVLFKIHIKEGESPPLEIKCHTYPHWVHCNPEVRTPTVMQELIFMPKQIKEEGSIIAYSSLDLNIKHCLILFVNIFPLSHPLVKQMLNNQPTAGFEKKTEM